MRDLHPFLLPAGLVLGLVFSATTAAVPVWLAQVTLKRGPAKGLSAAFATAAAHAFWAFVAGVLLFSMGTKFYVVAAGFRAGAVLILLFMAHMVLRAPRLASLNPEVELPARIVSFTFRRAFWMPMRLPGFLALFTAVNLPLRVYGVPNALLLSLGTGVGYFLWGAFFTTVAWYGRDVPEPICVRSLNKLRRLAVAVLLLLAVIGFAPFTFSNL